MVDQPFPFLQGHLVSSKDVFDGIVKLYKSKLLIFKGTILYCASCRRTNNGSHARQIPGRKGWDNGQ